MNNIFYVYGLIDPRDDKIFYIGKGKNNRKDSHLREALNTKRNFFQKRQNFIKLRKIWSILDEGLEPFSIILKDNLLESEAFNLEEKLIREYGLICDGTGCLSNLTYGGDGGQTPSENIKEKISKSLLKRYDTEEGKETKNKISKSSKKFYKTSEGKKSLLEMSFNLKKFWNTDKGKEILKNRSEKMKKWLYTEEGKKYIKNKNLSIKKAHADQNKYIENSKKMKNKWKEEDYKKSVSNGLYNSYQKKLKETPELIKEQYQKVSKSLMNHKVSDTTKEKISKANLNNKQIYKDGVYKTIKKEDISFYLTNGWILKGKEHGSRSEETNDKVSKKMTGKIFINKDKINKRVFKEELNYYINDGWKKGKYFPSVIINNGKEDKQILIEELDYWIKNGWNKGSFLRSNSIWINKNGYCKRIMINELDYYLNNNWKRGRK